jgi:hypothetical protein
MRNALYLEKNSPVLVINLRTEETLYVCQRFFINKLSGRQTLQNPHQTQIQHP